MESEAKRKRGAPLGNQNARKHGLYSTALSPQQLQKLPAAMKLQGLDNEIAVMRLKIHSILANDPDNDSAIVKAAKVLDRMVRTQCSLGILKKADKKQFTLRTNPPRA